MQVKEPCQAFCSVNCCIKHQFTNGASLHLPWVFAPCTLSRLVLVLTCFLGIRFCQLPSIAPRMYTPWPGATKGSKAGVWILLLLSLIPEKNSISFLSYLSRVLVCSFSLLGFALGLTLHGFHLVSLSLPWHPVCPVPPSQFHCIII